MPEYVVVTGVLLANQAGRTDSAEKSNSARPEPGLGRKLIGAVVVGAARWAVDLALPGSGLAVAIFKEVGEVAAREGWAWLRGRSAAEQQTALNEIAAMTPGQASEAGRADLAAYDLPDDARAQLAAFASAIPYTTRQATARVGDGGVTRTTRSQLPRSEAEMARFLPARPPRFQKGQQVPGHDYVLEALLGQGGYGEVWKAVNEFMPAEGPLALKFCLDEQVKASLRREIQLLNNVRAAGGHENIVRLTLTNYRNDPPFVGFEYIDGGDLGAWLAAFDGAPPPQDRVADVLTQAARGLAFAHTRGIIHRDIKPANILVRSDGVVKVGDFGIGAFTPQSADAIQATHMSGMTMLGGAATAAYVDPSRVDAAPDPAEDVYSLGLVGLQLLRGDILRPLPPTWRDDLEDLDADRRLVDVLIGCLRGRDRRISDGAALLDALVKLKGASGATTRTDPKAGATSAGADTARRAADRVSAAPKPADTIRDHKLAPELVVIPPGRFLMGSLLDEEDRSDNEGPQREVRIGYPLAVGKFPVTFAEWDVAVANGGCDGYRPDDKGWGRGNRPVINVSWEDAQRYVAWLRELTGQSYRLLSEAEWEYACRAGTVTPFWTGKTISTDQANYDGNYTYGAGAKGEYRRQTTPVGTSAANFFGVHDMHGNVWEWVEDPWHDSFVRAPSDGAAWLKSGDENRRVLRGGSWDDRPRRIRAAAREWIVIGRNSATGFRVARPL